MPRVGEFVGVPVFPRSYPRCLNWKTRSSKAVNLAAIEEYVKNNEVSDYASSRSLLNL